MASVTGSTNGTGKSTRVNGPAVTISEGRGVRVDKSLIGLCVVSIKGVMYLRVTLRPHHMKSIGNGERIDIRGSIRDGLLIAPGKMAKASKAGPDLLYAVVKLDSFDSRIAQEPRAQIWMRADLKNGHWQLPACPEAWVKAEGEYKRGVYHEAPLVFQPGAKQAQLSPFPGDGSATLHQDAKRVEPPTPPAPPAPVLVPASTQGVTAPLPRAQMPAYQVPDSLRDMEIELGTKIGEVRAILQAMHYKTGMHFTLDRNLRVTVVLREKPDK